MIGCYRRNGRWECLSQADLDALLRLGDDGLPIVLVAEGGTESIVQVAETAADVGRIEGGRRR